MVNEHKNTSDAIKDILHGDQGAFSYLFPYRDNVPVIDKHIFTDLKYSNKKIDEFIVEKMLDVNYIGWTAKYVLNLDLFPFQIATLQNLWKTTFPMLVMSRGGSKSYILAVYSVLRALLDQGSKVVIVGAGLRQAKVVFSYIETLWHNAPVLRSLVGGGKNAGPRQNVDLCYFKIGQSIITALPLGDGCVSKNTLTTYIDGFGTISEDQQKDVYQKNIVKRTRGIWGDGGFNISDESYCNGLQKTKKIRTNKGFEIEGTYNHKLKVLRDKKIVWVRIDEMKMGDNILIDRTYRWHNGRSDITKEESYAIGVLMGDGCFTSAYRIGFATKDEELSSAIQAIGKFKQSISDPVHWNMLGKQVKNKVLNKFDIDVNNSKTKDKEFPKTILRSSREVMSAFISGLFDTDGCVQVSTAKERTGIGVTFYNTSKRLVEQLQYILLHYGIVCRVSSRIRDEKWERCYELLITGKDILTFANQIGFKLERKQNKLLGGIKNKKRWMNQNDSVPGILEDMISICENNRIKKGTKKYCTFTCNRLKKLKIASRDKVNQFLQMYNEKLDPRIKRIKELSNNNIYYDEIVSIEESECITYDTHVPEIHEYCANGFHSHNSKIRGFRASVIIADEYASIPQEIFDVVVRGFAATTKSPVEGARNAAINKKLAKLGFTPEMSKEANNGLGKGNQIVYSGTASYRFNHFAKNFDLWKKIIKSKGNGKLIAEIFGGPNNVPENFSYKDYSVIRIPYSYLPDGLLDMRQIANAKATLPKNIFNMEYSALFMTDSDGYFPRSMIEFCTVTPSRSIATPDGEVTFTPMMEGIKGRKYVIGVDPGGERDKLAIVVIEVWKNHYRVVYCWSILKSEFNSRKKDNLVKEQDYYEYCCNKIKDLTRLFFPVRIEMDSQGGGYAIAESLRSKKGMNKSSGDFPIYEIIDYENIKETDGESDGPHILNLVKQSNEFNSQANECLYKSLETKRLLFPSFDTVVMHSALMAEKAGGISIDTYEECANNIEELKNEICMIQKSETLTGKDRFDTPTVLTPSTSEGRQTKGRLRKDRYSSLLIAHRFIYSEDVRPESSINYDDVAGNFRLISNEKIENKSLYTGPGIGSMKNAQDWLSGTRSSATKNGDMI